MKRFIALSLLATAACVGQAFADDMTIEPPFTSTRDRASVAAEAAQPHVGGNPWSIAYNPLATFKSGRTTAEVRAEYMAAREQVADFTGEDSGSFALQQTETVREQFAGQPVNAH